MNALKENKYLFFFAHALAIVRCECGVRKAGNEALDRVEEQKAGGNQESGWWWGMVVGVGVELDSERRDNCVNATKNQIKVPSTDKSEVTEDHPLVD